MGEIEGRLKAMEGNWKEATARDKINFEPLPEGTYEARVHRFDFHESQKDRTLRLQTEFEVLEPEKYKGRRVSSFHALEGDPTTLGYTKTHLRQLEVPLDPLVEIKDRLGDALDRVCEVATKHREHNGKVYVNVYLNKVLGGTASKEDAGDPDPSDFDEIPF